MDMHLTKPPQERSLGFITRHHLVPQQRIRDYYGLPFGLPRNFLRLRERKHAAWHWLFGQKTLNEVIRYLRGRVTTIRGYKGEWWKILFKNKTARQAANLLRRMRRIVRGKYAGLELDPKLKERVRYLHMLLISRDIVAAFLNTRFSRAA